MAKAAKSPRTPRRKKPSGFLPGMTPPSVPELDAAAEAYHAVKTARMALTEEEAEKKAIMAGIMKKRDLTAYVTPDGLEVLRSFDESVSCKRKKATKPEGETKGRRKRKEADDADAEE